MAWTEIAAQRTQWSRTYEQDAQRHLTAAMAALHYESVIDSGTYDAAVDLTPVRVDNEQLDGWRVIFLGCDVPLDDVGWSVNTFEPDLVVLSAATAAQTPKVAEVISRLRAAP